MGAATCSSTLLDAALRYAVDFDWHVFPVNGKKRPAIKDGNGFYDASNDPQRIRELWRENPDWNIGAACGASGLIGVDLDVKNGVDGLASWAALTADHEPITTAQARTPSGGRHIYFRAPELVEVRNSAGKIGPGVDVRGDGGYIVLPPSRTADGAYEWIRPLEDGIVPCPEWLLKLLARPEPKPRLEPSAHDDRDQGPYLDAAISGEVARVRTAAIGTRNATLNEAAFSLGGLIALGLSEDLITSELLGAAVGAGLPEAEARKTVASGIAAGREHPREIPEDRPTSRSLAGEAVTGTVDEIKATRLTELASAHRLKEHHGHDIRHAKSVGWLHWDGKRWEPSDKGVERLAHALGRHVRAEAVTIREPEIAKAYFSHARALERADGIRAIMSIAKSVYGIDANRLEWDADPLLLNCENGTVDLTTGALRPHRREDHITKIVPVEYDPEATCPRWHRFLNEIFDHDRNLIAYVGWLLGYAITGLTKHDLFAIFHGTGANGKTTLLSTIQRILGDGYTQQIDTEDLLQQKYGRHSTGIAALRGARLVVAQESGESRHLNEPLIKSLTGGDKIRARFIGQDGFEFFPTLKLILSTNHRPTVRDTSNGLWRRVRLIPFSRAFTGTDCDPNLRQTLWAERRGILAWAVENARNADAEPPLPDTVKAATQDYRVEQDIIASFLSECCDLSPHGLVEKGILYHRYEAWSGGKCESQRAFGDRLRGRGFDEYRGHGGIRQWIGISLCCNDLENQGDVG